VLAHVAAMIFNPTGVPIIKLFFGKSACQLLHLAPHGGQPFRVDFMNDPPGIRQGILNLQEPP